MTAPRATCICIGTGLDTKAHEFMSEVCMCTHVFVYAHMLKLSTDLKHRRDTEPKALQLKTSIQFNFWKKIWKTITLFVGHHIHSQLQCFIVLCHNGAALVS